MLNHPPPQIESNHPAAAISAIARDTHEFVNCIDELATLESDAIAACRRARAEVAAGGDRLRRVHEAGVRLNAVALSPGVRGASRGETPLQAITRAAGISRETANTWKTVGQVPADDLEKYIAGREAKGKEVTMAGLLKLCRPPSSSDAFLIRIKGLTESEHERFAHQLKVLGSTVLHTRGEGDTIVAAVGRLYEDVLRQRQPRDVEGVAGSPAPAPKRILRFKSSQNDLAGGRRND